MSAVNNLYLWATPVTRFETSWLSNSSALDIWIDLNFSTVTVFHCRHMAA